MTIEGESRMATATSSYTTASRYCQPLTDSPAPSPGPSSTVRAWCRGHSHPPGNPDSGRRFIVDAGQVLVEFQVNHLFILRAIRCCALPCWPTTPPSKRKWTSSSGAGMPSHDPRERRPGMMPVLRGQPQSWHRRRRPSRRNPARNPDHPGRPAPSRGQPWW